MRFVFFIIQLSGLFGLSYIAFIIMVRYHKEHNTK